MSKHRTFRFSIKFETKMLAIKDRPNGLISVKTQIGPRVARENIDFKLAYRVGEVTEAYTSDLRCLGDIVDTLGQSEGMPIPTSFSYAATVSIFQCLRYSSPKDEAGTLVRHALEIVQDMAGRTDGSSRALRVSRPNARGDVTGSVITTFDFNRSWVAQQAIGPWSGRT